MTRTRCSRAVVMVKIQLVRHKLDEVGVCNSVLYSIEKVEDIGQKILLQLTKLRNNCSTNYS